MTTPFADQILAHLPSEVCPPSSPTIDQVKDLVLDQMVITLGARKTVRWLSEIARKLLRPLPVKVITVLVHAFLPQLTYEGESGYCIFSNGKPGLP